MNDPIQFRPLSFFRPPRILRQLASAGLLALASTLLATAQFTPGEGGAVPNLPELREPDTSITSLWVSQTDRENYHFSSGNYPALDLKFKSPTSYGATGFDLQISPDGISGWETLYPTSGPSQDNFSFDPEGSNFYRLLVHGGPRDGQVSNVIEGETSQVPTQFSGWGGGSVWTPDGPNAPWLGHSLTAYFTVRNLADSSDVTGGIVFQWYRRNPQTGGMTPIPGATQNTYTTTADDLGGYQLICRGTGDGVTVGGYAQMMMGESPVIFNNAQATAISRSGFTLNLYKSVPSLTAGDLTLSYWNGSSEEEIPITAVSAQPGNAVFTIEVDVPAAVTDARLSNHSGVWKIGSLFEMGGFSDQMPDLTITFPPTEGTTFADWAVDSDIPEDRRGPLDRNGPLMIQNLIAYSMGLNPMTVTNDKLPEVSSLEPVSGTIHLIYQRAKNLGDATLTPKISTDLKNWSAADVVSETILEDGGTWEKVDATINVASLSSAFFDFEAQQLESPPL